MACPHAFRPVGRAAMGAVRHILACSRPHHHHHASAMELENDDYSTDGDMHDECGAPEEGLTRIKKHVKHVNDASEIASKRQSIAELHAVLRHIEVRWQLFNESMSKFHDPEAMLANCTDDVVWSTENGEMINGKNQELLAVLRGFIERKVSLEVEIESIIRITLTGFADLVLDKHGKCAPPSALESARTNTALQALNLIDPVSRAFISPSTDAFSATSTSAAAASSSSSSTTMNSRPPFFILAKDTYSLKSIEGDVVERGRRAVLWQQHKSSWYIRGYLCY